MANENAINNSWQIASEFRCRKHFYKCPLPRKLQRVQAPCEPNGECRCYSKYEIFFYECWQAMMNFVNNTDCLMIERTKE